MKSKKIIIITVILLFICSLCICTLYFFSNKEYKINGPENLYTTDSVLENEDTPVFLQFYDWFNTPNWEESSFVDPINWEAIGITNNDRNSEEFYYKQFSYIKSLGVDAISWEFHPRKDAESLYPSENAIKALKKAGLKIACFFDYEVAIKTVEDSELVATLSDSGVISPDDETVNFIIDNLKQFYEHVPSDLLAYDKKGRQVIFVYGYDFNDENELPELWDNFATNLIKQTKDLVGAEPVYYWTCKNSSFEEHLYQHYKDYFVPFQFVLDTPQSQFSSDAVTWNFGYDNLGVQVRDNLQRVIKLDKRYIEEMGWLSKAANPSLVFIYGWNEPFEGSMLIPTEQWGDTKARLAKYFIDRLKNGNDKVLKKTLLITDDLDNYYTTSKNDWHYDIERELLLYFMRRYLPQSDICMADEVTEDLLNKYESIVDISVDKNDDTTDLILNCIDEKQVVIFDPKSGYTKSKLSGYFAKIGENIQVNDNVKLVNTDDKIYVRDDINDAKVNFLTSSVILSARLNSKKLPIIVKKDDDIWVNAYDTEESVLKTVFEVFYNTDMQISIMYGEGLASQRLEIDTNTKKITMNTLSKYSVNRHWKIPDDINWFVMPQDIDKKYYNFIFGIDE